MKKGKGDRQGAVVVKFYFLLVIHCLIISNFPHKNLIQSMDKTVKPIKLALVLLYSSNRRIEEKVIGQMTIGDSMRVVHLLAFKTFLHVLNLKK